MAYFADDANRPYSLGREIRTPIPRGWDEGFGTAQTRILNDLRVVEAPMPVYQQLIQEGLVSGIQALLMDQGQPTGVLGLNADTTGFFTDEHQTIATQIANQLAIAIRQLNRSETLARHATESERHVVELRQVEASLRQSEARYRLLAENMADVIWILDVSTLLKSGKSLSERCVRKYKVITE